MRHTVSRWPARVLAVVCSLLLLACPAAAEEPKEPKEDEAPQSIDKLTADLEKIPGYFTLYWDQRKGRLLLEIDRWDEEFLYVGSMPRGVGSNDIGLDRGQLGRTRVVSFRRVGPKVLLVQTNLAYRAVTDDADERRAVEESFAKSVLFGFQVTAEGDNGRVVVDATKFALQDAHGVANTLRRLNEGEYKLDDSRSAVFLDRTKGFPDNTEIEVTLTFTGQPKGRHLPTVAPTPESVTVHQRHSLIRLPDDQYTPREFHPGSGFFATEFRDYAAPLGRPLDRRYILRHRLEKKDPAAEVSEAVEPIVYRLDRGTPEPIREALLTGAGWWAEAFEKAGFRDAFRVEMMPLGADPMDVRYNVIQWVHRSTRGWSYGSTVADPRTGEIIKGHVSLGSLRVRQDMTIAEGLLSPFDGRGDSPAATEMALARLRQLSAHEVGHTLGLAHNFAASTRGNASVMDYPHPYIGLGEDGGLDVSRAYAVGVGKWDGVAIAYGYRQFAEDADESVALSNILNDAWKDGLTFISDRDARPTGGAHPDAHLWDNGADPAAELGRLLEVRRRALAAFDERAVPPGTPLSALEERLAPVYLLHRYQTEATAKLLGGVAYTYAVRGEGDRAVSVVEPGRQKEALQALLRTLEPETLAMPESVLKLIPPRAEGFDRSREQFSSKTGPTLDPLAAASASASHTVGLILEPARCARLIEQAARDPESPGLGMVLDGLLVNAWRAPGENAYHAEIRRAVDDVILYHLMRLIVHPSATDSVKATAWLKLRSLKERLGDAETAHAGYTVWRIERFMEHPERIPVPEPAELPPGSPIGACGWGCGCGGW